MTKLLLLLCCTYTLASQHSHIIPVENYDTELQDLGQHTEHHETPVKVIKITKTIAVKIPVPYPVKVIEKVPYPVHVNKPYPVHVPHVIQLPKERTVKLQPHHDNGGQSENHGDYQVQEAPAHDAPSGSEHSFAPLTEHIHVGPYNYGNVQHHGAPSDHADPGSYNAPAGGQHGYASEDLDGPSYGESKAYNAIKSYL